MKVRTKVVKTYHCDVCSEGYPKPQEAKNCEKYPVEERVAEIGVRVKLTGERSCSCGKNYFANGRVEKITNPQSVPFGNALVLYGKRQESPVHPIGYIVSYNCPSCRSNYKLVAYSHEFAILKKATPKKRTALA